MKHDLVIKPRPTDYIKGVNSPLVLSAVGNGVWPVNFNENQRNPLFDTDGCACYCANKVLDSWMDFLWPSFPSSLTSALQPYLDLGLDGLPHFHSSPWFTENLTGNGQNGNSIPECFDVIRKYGAIPYTAFQFTPTTTPEEYFVQPSATLLAQGALFLSLMGGKNFLQYHWVTENNPKNIEQMSTAILESPLSIGINVDDAGWNQTTPVDPPNAPPVHAVMNYKIQSPNVDISDNYNPYLKVLDQDYPINYVLQAIVKYLAPIEQEIVQDTAQAVQDTANLPPSEKENILVEVGEELKEIVETIL